MDKGADFLTAIFEAKERFYPNTVPLDRLGQGLDLAIGLRVVRRGPDVLKLHESQKPLEVPRHELASVVADDARPSPGKTLQGSLEHDLHIPLGHVHPQFMVDHEAAVAIQHSDQKHESASNGNVRDVDVPVFVRPPGLFEASLFGLARRSPAVQQSMAFEHPIGGGWADRHYVVVQHLVRQIPIADSRAAPGVVHNGLDSPRLQPEVPGHLPVVPVGKPETSLPLVELTGR